MHSQTLFDFNQDTDISQWRVVDDVVMGGKSDGKMLLNEAGNGVFSGTVSLENNGGFSSVRHRFETKSLRGFGKLKMKIKGDGSRYQFRFKTDSSDRHSYIAYFDTSGDRETITLKLSDFYPAFRGRTLDMPNFPGESAEEIAILIGNKKAQEFRLEIDKIELVH